MLSITSFINHSKFGLVNFLLLPFSAIFFIFSYIRLCLYKVRLLKVSVSSVPVIVIGNITAGGTGKTPIVIAVANYFASRNKMVGVVSRGYGGKYAQESLEVTSTSDPIDCGDEPLLIKQQTEAFVVVAKKRSNAVKFLTENYSVDLIISDDGLQHYAMGRDIEIAVIDGHNRLGNGLVSSSRTSKRIKKKAQVS